MEVPSKTKAQPSSAVCEDKGHEREVHPPGWSASLGAIHHTREMSTSPSGSGGDVEAPRSRWLQLGVTNPILLELVLLKLTQSFRLVGKTYHSETGQKKKKKKGKRDLQWHVLQDSHVSLGALSLAKSFTAVLRAEITTLV